MAGTNFNNLRRADDTTLMAESEEELKSLLMKGKEESEKAGLKLNIQKTEIMASSPITSQQIDWGKVGTMAALIFLGSKPGTKVTARSSLIMGWFSCAAALLGSQTPRGSPHSTSTCL